MMKAFLRELNKRRVTRVAIAYLIISWIVLQVADVVLPAMGLPDWSITLVLVVLAAACRFGQFHALACHGRREANVKRGGRLKYLNLRYFCAVVEGLKKFHTSFTLAIVKIESL